MSKKPFLSLIPKRVLLLFLYYGIHILAIIVNHLFTIHEVNFLFPRMTNTTTKKTSGQCKTRNGVPCVFPFTYHGTKYTSCKTWWESKGSSWCATKTLNGKYIGIWGWCSEDCSVHTGK